MGFGVVEIEAVASRSGAVRAMVSAVAGLPRAVNTAPNRTPSLKNIFSPFSVKLFSFNFQSRVKDTKYVKISGIFTVK